MTFDFDDPNFKLLYLSHAQTTIFIIKVCFPANADNSGYGNDIFWNFIRVYESIKPLNFKYAITSSGNKLFGCANSCTTGVTTLSGVSFNVTKMYLCSTNNCNLANSSSYSVTCNIDFEAFRKGDELEKELIILPFIFIFIFIFYTHRLLIDHIVNSYVYITQEVVDK